MAVQLPRERYTIPQAGIDPKTGRFCATLAEISKGLRIHPYQVIKCNPRRYRKKYLDVLDVIDARKKTPGPGRPRVTLTIKAGNKRSRRIK